MENILNDKKEFEFQYYYRRWLGGFPVLIIMLILNAVIINMFQNKLTFWFISGIIMIVLLIIYYKITQNHFLGKGIYYKKDNSIIIELENKKYIIDDVKEIIGSVINIYTNKVAMLSITTDRQNIKIFSKQLKKDQEFKESSIYEIYDVIVQHFKDLEKVKVLNQEQDFCLKKIDQQD